MLLACVWLVAVAAGAASVRVAANGGSLGYWCACARQRWQPMLLLCVRLAAVDAIVAGVRVSVNALKNDPLFSYHHHQPYVSQ